jgi:polyisoprenoid-binding protein YceI
MVGKFLAVALFASLTAPALAAGETTWVADPHHSSANFTVAHFGISRVNGIIPIANATVVLPAGSNIPVSAQADLDPNGIDTRESDRDADLRSAHFFDVATYPKMTFTSTKVTPIDATHFTMTGDFTMHGQTHAIDLQGTYLGRVTTPRGQERVAYVAKATIDRTQWGMTYGSPVAANAVDLEIDIEAVQKPAP